MVLWVGALAAGQATRLPRGAACMRKISSSQKIGWACRLLVALATSAVAEKRALFQGLAPAAPAAVAGKPNDDVDETKDPSEEKFPGGAALKTDPEQQRLLKRA